MLIVTSRTRSSGNRAPIGRFSLNKDSQQSRGLVGWWPCMEGSGTTLRDYSGRNNNSIGNSSNWGIEDWNLRSNDFAVGQDYTSNVISDLSGKTNITVSFWAKSSAYLTNNGAVAVRTGSSSGDLLYIYPYDDKNGNGLRVFYNSPTVVDANLSSLADNSWHLFHYVQTGTFHEGFEDGESVGSSTNSQTVSTAPIVDIGHWNGSQDATFPIRDVRVYMTSHTKQQVWNQYSPQTRWDLFWQKGKTYFMPDAVVGGTPFFRSRTTFGTRAGSRQAA